MACAQRTRTSGARRMRGEVAHESVRRRTPSEPLDAGIELVGRAVSGYHGGIVARADRGDELVDCNALLGHAVALADRHRVVLLHGLEVDRHTPGCADLVLASVASADALGIVELGRE